MHKDKLAAALAICLLGVGGVAFAQEAPVPATRTTTTTTTVATASQALSEGAIKTSIGNAGYKEVKGLKFADGVWQAKARGGNDQWVRIRVGPDTGKVYQADAPSRLNANEIKAKLSAQGYQHIHDVKYDDGLWEADARNTHDHDVEILADPDNGSVVSVRRD